MAFPTALPTPRTPDPRAGRPVSWGILGTGWIADRFVSSVLANTHHRVAAVGSRTQESAERFARAHEGTPRGSYDALVADPDVEVVYVASPHPQHVEHALLAIEAGKHVLVEKPVAVNAEGARRIAEAAQARGVLAMEAMWTLCLPKLDVVRQLLHDGVLGDLTCVSADIGEYFDPGHRIYDPRLAGGAMMDLGTYPVTLATWVLGEATDVQAQGERGPGGVMAQISMLLRHGQAQSVLHASALVATPTRAAVSGTEGWLSFDGPWYQPGSFVLRDRDGRELTHDEEPIAHQGLYHEAVEVARCLETGTTESGIRPLDETIRTLETMDRVRAATGDQLVSN